MTIPNYAITNPIFVDLETTADGLKGSPEAHWQDNHIILCGWAELPVYGDPVVHVNRDPWALITRICEIYKDTHQMVTIVAHNAKFDIKHLYRVAPLFDWKRMVTCYCTMYAEYRLSGMTSQFPSLEGSCASRGIKFAKGLDLGALITSGVKMQDIPLPDLKSYLVKDVVAVMQLFCHQIQQNGAEHIRHGHIMALADIETNGMELDVGLARQTMGLYYTRRDKAESKLDDLLVKYMDWKMYKDRKNIVHTIPFDPKDIKTTAPRTISFLLTGYPKDQITKGVKKTARLTREPMLTIPQIQAIWPKAKPTHLGFPMDEKSLMKVAKVLNNDFIETLLEFRKTTKVMNTYLGPCLEQADTPSASNLPTVHPKLNCVRTATGRLSSSDPNGQNMPEVVRQLFKSELGNLAEIDFKQLEIIALAMKSGCPFLRSHLIRGQDVHYLTGRRVFGWSDVSQMTEKDRKSVKAVNFGVLFGGTAFGLSLSTGLKRSLVQDLIDSLYQEYPGVKAWHDRIVREVAVNAVPAGFVNGTQVYTSDMKDPGTGRVFRFRQSKGGYGNKWDFKPTQIKNYPVQGFAGGDIVMIALEKLWRGLDNSVGKLRMTVHDSILVDYAGTQQVLEVLMDEVCKDTCKELGIDLPLKYDVSFDTHWS